MIPLTLRITLMAALLFYFILICIFLKNKSLSLKYTLIWIAAGIVMGILVIFPGLWSGFIHLFGIQSNMNGLFLCAIGFLVCILMSLTSIVSRQMAKINRLVQRIAVLEERLRKLEGGKGEKIMNYAGQRFGVFKEGKEEDESKNQR